MTDCCAGAGAGGFGIRNYPTRFAQRIRRESSPRCMFKSVLRLLQVVKHPVSDGDCTPPEVIPPKEAGVLTQLAFGKTPTSKRSVGGGYDKYLTGGNCRPFYMMKVLLHNLRHYLCKKCDLSEISH